MKIVKGLSVVTLILFMCGLFYVAYEPVEVSALDKPVKKETIKVSKMENNHDEVIVPAITSDMVEPIIVETISDLSGLGDVEVGLEEAVIDYASSICERYGYASYQVFDVYNVVSEDYITVHLVFDDTRYCCISVERNPIEVIELYNCILTQDLIDNWEYN